MTLPTLLPEVLEALRNAGATEEMIAAAVKASGELQIPHRSRGGRPRKPAWSNLLAEAMRQIGHLFLEKSGATQSDTTH
jgi:hypothetical protein